MLPYVELPAIAVGPFRVEPFGALVVLGCLLVGLVFVLWRRSLPAGAITGVGLSYAPVRFLLDFLRIGEARYAGLTPAQYLSVALVVASVWVLLHAGRPGPAVAGQRP